MGLLEKASQITGQTGDEAGVAAPGASGAIAGAVHGLRARAEAMRQRAGTVADTPADTASALQATRASAAPVGAAAAAGDAMQGRSASGDGDFGAAAPASADSGVRIRGLLRRAESLREAEGLGTEIPPLPAGAARGLLARARSFREAPSGPAAPALAPAAEARQPGAAPVHPPASPAAPGSPAATPAAVTEPSAPRIDATRPTEATTAPEAMRGEHVAAAPAAPDQAALYEVEELEPQEAEAFPDDTAGYEAESIASASDEDEELVLSAPELVPGDPAVADAPPASPTRTAGESAPPEPAADDGLRSAEALAPTSPDPAADPAGGLEDPLFDDLVPESYEGGPREEPQTSAPPESPADGAPDLPDLDPGPAPVDAGLRDFDEFLERELLPEELPADTRAPEGDSSPASAPAPSGDAEEAVAEKPPAMFADEDYDALIDPNSDLRDAARDGDLPRWPYDPPGADADPARESSGRQPGEEDDPFGLWEMDAEKEAEQQARQLELRGEKPADRDEEGMLFAVDEGFTTAPVEAHIASQKKIDHYLSLFDITKEISNISEFDELWENILYAIMGQVGAETICILSSTSRVSSGAIFYPVSHSGFELPEGWALGRGDEIYDQMASSTGVRYAEEFLTSLQNPISPMERRILENTRAKLVVPLKNMNQMFGIVILGGQVSGDDYTIDDIEFLTLLGEIAAVGVDRVLSRIEFERDTEELRRRNMVHGSMFSLARRASGVKSLDDVYDILTRHLREDFYAESFSVVLLSPRDRRYRIFAGNEISPESIEKFSLDVNSELIATISNLVRVYDLKDFRENRELTACYTNDDLGLMQHYWIVPLINMNWLVGFITIHRTRIPWTEFHRELMVTAAEIVSSVFANCIIMNERESLFRDPFSPLEERLKQELQKSARFSAPVSLVDVRVKNIRRILEINPGEEVTGFLMSLNRSIASSLFETDFMARVGQGRFALILPGRGRVEAEIFVKKLKADFNRMRLLPGSPIDVQYAHQIISAPDDADEAGKMLSIFE